MGKSCNKSILLSGLSLLPSLFSRALHLVNRLLTQATELTYAP